MKFPKSLRSIRALIGALVFIILLYVQITTGTFVEFIFEFMITIVVISVSVVLPIILMRKLKPWSRASQTELEREDSAFIEWIGFLQATLLLFVTNYMVKDFLSLFLSMSIIFVTVVFYVFRAYAHIQDDSHWRWLSIEVLLIAVMIQGRGFISFLFTEFFHLFLPDWLNVTIISAMPFFILVTIFDDLRTRFHVRYDLPS